ncbi:hypothetical protein GCM10027443_17620 [Pontibacter brevis]
MDWFNFLHGIVFLLTGIILLLAKLTYFKNKDREWLTYGNVKLISGAILGITFGVYFIVTSL